MIVPAPRLLAFAGATLLPLAALSALLPAWSGAFLAAAAALAAVASYDAWSARAALADVGVALPPLLRLTKDRDGSLDVTLSALRVPARIRVGLVIPPELGAAREEELVELAPPGGSWTLSWPLRPTARGRFLLTDARVEAASPLGLFAVREARSVSLEARVYPNLLLERRDVAALFLRRGGVHAQRQVGKGREFEKLREYVPGDGFDEIHWKATARRGRPITKVFQVERTQEVYAVVDASRLSARRLGDAGDPLLERFVTAALVLGVAAERQGDAFGVVAYSDRIEAFRRARPGREPFRGCRDALYALAPRRAPPDLDELFAFLRRELRRRALLVFLTALDDPHLAETFVARLSLVSPPHLVLVNVLQPPEAAPLFSDESVSSVDDVYGALAGHLLWSRFKELGASLARRGASFGLLSSEHASADVVSRYMNVKMRQAL